MSLLDLQEADGRACMTEMACDFYVKQMTTKLNLVAAKDSLRKKRRYFEDDYL